MYSYGAKVSQEQQHKFCVFCVFATSLIFKVKHKEIRF